MEERNEAQEQQVEQQEQTQEQPQQEEQQEQPQQEQTQEQPQENSKEYNFKALREQKEKAEQEKQQMQQQMQEMQQYLQQVHQQQQMYQQNQQPQQKKEEEIKVNDYDLVDGRSFNKQMRKIQEELNRYKQQNEMTLAQQQLQAKYPDFNKVLTDENVAKLEKQHPSVASTLKQAKNWKEKGESAYLFLKQLGIAGGNNYEKEKQQVQKNVSKPQPMNSVSPQTGESPMSNANAFANGLTPELKKKLYKEMKASSGER